MRLADTKPGQEGKITAINGDTHFISRITSIGVTEGTPFQTVKNDSKMPVLVYLRETLIAINRNDAGKVEVHVNE